MIELVREPVASQSGAKVVLRTLERSKRQGPAFETYRTKALLERFEERAPAALDLEAFLEAQG